MSLVLVRLDPSPFNQRSQRVIHRQENVSQIDIDALKSALAKGDAGTINYHSLQDLHGQSKFIAGILAGEIATDAPQRDVVIIAGPKTSVDGKVPWSSCWRYHVEVNCPIFYFSYVAVPMGEPFRHSIRRGSEGIQEYFRLYDHTPAR